MTTIPDAAIEAATTALDAYTHLPRHAALNALEAAMPAIREAIAQEIEAGIPDGPIFQWGKDAYEDAARIVRGGTP